MNETLQFLQGFVKNPLSVGAIAPSSAALVEVMLEGVSANPENIILEIGVGTGAVTRILQTKICDEKSYLGIEINADFVKTLNLEFPHLKIICGDAGHAEKIYRESGFGQVRFILSGLPFAALPVAVSNSILREIDKFMLQGCLFRTFQYLHGYYLPPAIKFRKHMNEKYGEVEISEIVLQNLPPAYTLTWRT